MVCDFLNIAVKFDSKVYYTLKKLLFFDLEANPSYKIWKI